MGTRNNIIGGFSKAALFILALGVVLLIDSLSRDLFTRHLGIQPRDLNGLDGVLFAPLLHGDLGHYLSNALPMIVLLGLLFANRNYRPVQSLAIVWLLGGLGTWLIGRPNSTHIGASIVIFGLVTFLICAVVFPSELAVGHGQHSGPVSLRRNFSERPPSIVEQQYAGKHFMGRASLRCHRRRYRRLDDPKKIGAGLFGPTP